MPTPRRESGDINFEPFKERSMTVTDQPPTSAGGAIRPYRVDIPEEAVADLRSLRAAFRTYRG
jgi:hypothetical protein